MGSSNARGLRVSVAILLCLSALAALYSLGAYLVEAAGYGVIVEYDIVIGLRALELAAFVVLVVAMARGSLKLAGAGAAVLLSAQIAALGIAAMQGILLGSSYEGAFYLEKILTFAGALLLTVGAFSRKAKAPRVAAMILFWLVLITNTVYELSWLPEYVWVSDFTAETVLGCLVALFRDLGAPLGLMLLSVWAVVQDGFADDGKSSDSKASDCGHSVESVGYEVPAAMTAADMEHYARLFDRGILSKEEFESIRHSYLSS